MAFEKLFDVIGLSPHFEVGAIQVLFLWLSTGTT